MFRRRDAGVEVLLVHPGGPYWRGKDAGAWTIPKGGIGESESPEDAALREFREETGFEPAPREAWLPLGTVKLKSGKTVHAWAFEGDCDVAAIRSNAFSMEWPPRSKKMCEFPEVDRGAFFDLPSAKEKINPRQAALLDALEKALAERRGA